MRNTLDALASSRPRKLDLFGGTEALRHSRGQHRLCLATFLGSMGKPGMESGVLGVPALSRIVGPNWTCDTCDLCS